MFSSFITFRSEVPDSKNQGARSWSNDLVLWICLVTIFTIFSSIRAQQPSFQHFTEANGLPSNNIYSVLLDHKDLLWFSSDKGITRFDGLAFQNYTMKNGLPDNEVFSLFEDHWGRIWFGTYNGIPGFVYNGMFYNPKNLLSLRDIHMTNYISSIAEDKNGNILLASRDGNVHLIPLFGQGRFVLGEHPSSMAAIGIRSNGLVDFAISSCEILSWNNGQKHFHHLIPEMNPVNGGELMVASSLSDGTFILGFGNKLSVIDSLYQRVNYINSSLAADGASIILIKEIPSLGIVLCTTKGAYLYQTKDFSKPYNARYLPDVHISNVCIDREGGLWFTSNDGVWYSPEPEIVVQKPVAPNGSKTITSLMVSNANLFILGQQDGAISSMDTSLSTPTEYQCDIHSGSGTSVSEILPINDQLFWVASETQLALGDIGQKRVFPTLLDRTIDIARNPVSSEICFCSPFGWKVFDEDSLIDIALDSRPFYSNFKTVDRCHSISYDCYGNLWVATNSSFLKICGNDTIDLTEYVKSYGDYRVTDIASDSVGNIWIATAGAGLFWITSPNLRIINVRYGFETGIINRVKVLDNSMLAIATDEGLFSVNYDDKTGSLDLSAPLGSLDGLPSDEILDFALVGDTLWVATEEGLCSLPFSMFHQRSLQPKVAINSFIIGLNDTIHEPNYSLPYNHGGIRVCFSGLCYRSHGKFEYKYRIKGRENIWHSTKIGQVEIPYLEPGQYTFEVHACNHQGNWTAVPAVLKFQIEAPFWKKTWFLTLVPVSVLLILLLGFKKLWDQERTKTILRQNLLDAEQRALIGQMNPHFIFNSLNSIQNFFMTRDSIQANAYLADFAELIRSILNNSRASVVSLSNEISELTLYLRLEHIRLDGRFETRITIDECVDVKEVGIPTMLLQPFVENAVWHGITPLVDRQGKISISFSFDQDFLICIVEDNGIGREQSRIKQLSFVQKHKSLAMAIATERIALINGSQEKQISLEIIDLFDVDNKPCGTKVVIAIPKLKYIREEE